MAICYEEDSPARSGRPPFKIDSCLGFCRHYENYVYLQFIAQNTNDRVERAQALKELTICERKMDYFKRKHDFVLGDVLPQVEKIKNVWKDKVTFKVVEGVA